MTSNDEKKITKEEAKEKKRDRQVLWWSAIISALAVIISAGIQIYPTLKADDPAPSSSLQLEQIEQEVSAFFGSDGPVSGDASLRIAYETEYNPKYILNYKIPEASLSFTGLAFEFSKSVSVADYEFVQFVVEFSRPGDSVEIYLVDLAGNRAAVRISDNGNGKVEASVPLKNFSDVDLNAISEINFFTRNETKSESYDIVISKIRFSK